MSTETPIPVPAAERSWLTGRRLLWGLAFGFLALLLVGAFALFLAYRRADATVARHRARLAGERAALEALPRGRPALLEPVQAGDAVSVVDAFLAAVDRVPAAERLRLAPFATDPVPAAGEDAVLAAYPGPIAALGPLLFVPSVPPPLPVNPLVGDSVWRYEQGFKWLDAAATRLVAKGAGEDALRIALLMFAYSDAVARRGTTVHRMYGIAMEGVATRRARDALVAGRIDPDEARRLGRAFDDLERARLPLGTTLAFERMLLRATLCDPSADAHTLDWPGRSGAWRLWPAKLRLAEVLDGWDAALDGMTAAVGSPSEDGTATVRRAEAAAKNENVFLSFCLAMWPKVLRNEAHGRARTRVLRTALAVAEWTARKGSHPASLAELVPDFLPAVPIDPWDGKPLRYAAGKVWSIGQDGKDDGGTSPDPDSDDRGDLFAEVPPVK